MIQIVLTNHAKYRLLERNIVVSQIKKMVKDAPRTKRESDDTISTRAALADGRVVKVFYKLAGNKIIILTAYYAD